MKKKYSNICTYLYVIYLSSFIFSVSFILFSCKKSISDLDVAGGIVVKDGDYPGVVHLRASSYCTGAVISSNTILTAAHCTKNGGKEHYLMKNGTNDLVRVKIVSGNTKYKWPRDGYLDEQTESGRYDTAVWVFEDDALKDIKGKLQISDIKPKVSDEVRLIGWGCYIKFQQVAFQGKYVNSLTCDTRYNTERRTGTNKIMAIPDDLSYMKIYSETSIIDSSTNVEQSATGKGVLVTFGDSGGPLLLENQPTKMVGIASYTDTPWWPMCNDANYKNKDDEHKMDCEKMFSGYSNPVSSYNMPLLQDMVDNHGAIIPGVQVGVGVVEYNGKVKVLYKEESTSFNDKVQERKVINRFNGSSYSSVSSLRQAWRKTDFYDRSKASWEFEN